MSSPTRHNKLIDTAVYESCKNIEDASHGDRKKDLPVIKDLLYYLRAPSSSEIPSSGTASMSSTFQKNSTMALPVAAMKSLMEVIRRSRANTMMGLQDELREASNDMIEFVTKDSPHVLAGRSYIAISSGCELFMKYVTRTYLELPSFKDCISEVLERAEQFASISLTARSKIAMIGQSFIQDGQTVLIHGYSRTVMELLLCASHKHFSIVVLEGRPDGCGAKMAISALKEAGIPTTVVLDSAMGYVMERYADLVIVGAEAVVENGGIVNKIGTYGLGMCAKELGKPFYVAVESYKFARFFPLNQADLHDIVGNEEGLGFVDTSQKESHDSSGVPQLIELPENMHVENPPFDYTPAKYIHLLFTDLGVITPSAVSDELIRLYQ